MNIAIVAVVIPQVKNLTDVSIRKLAIIDTDKYGNDDYSIIKTVEAKLIEEFKVKTITQIAVNIRMNIIKRDKIEDANLNVEEICNNFLLDEVFGKYM